jgi:hypothetical protein
MGTGLAGMVLLLISLGLAKVAPKAPPEPTPRPPAPPELTPGDPVPADPVPAEDPNAPVPEVTVERDALAQELGLDRTLFDRLSEDLAGRLRQLMQGLSRDRIGGLRRYLQRNLERGRWPDPLVEDLLTMPDDELPEFLDRQAGVTWEPNWRGEPHIEDGNAAEGWQHINERHITGDQPGGDLFPEGTTRAEVEAAAEEVVARGTRLSNPARRMQVFEDRLTVHGRVFRVRVTVDAVDGRVITVFPVITGP